MQLEIEETALKKETDRLSMDRLQELQKELAELRDDYKAKVAQWENEKTEVEKVSALRARIEEINNEIEMAERSYDLDKLSQLKYGELPQALKELED